MPWTRRGLLRSSVAALLAPDSLVARVGFGGDFALLGISSTWPEEVEPRELLGEWKDQSWSRVYLRIAPGPSAQEMLATRIHKDGSMDHHRGVLVHAKGRNDVLDLTPAAARAPGEVAPHLLFKLEMTGVGALSIGTPRGMRKEFGHHPGKLYHRLHMTPLKASGVREIEGAPPVLANDGPGPAGRDVLVSATTAQVAEFLEKHGGDASCWKGEHDTIKLVQRLPRDE